jgi:hypothetical protein
LKLKKKKTLMILNLCTGLGITLYWLLVFAGVFPVEEIVPGYKNWFMSFPVADLWIAVCAFLSFKYLRSNDDKVILFGLLAGSSLIFLGLYAFLYGINTGLLFILTVDEIIEIGIKIYCLTVGPYLIVNLWKAR